MGRHGYQTAVEGKNGFVCLLERAWMSPFDNPEFWNSKNRSPDCFNPPAARTILPLIKRRTDMVLAGALQGATYRETKGGEGHERNPAAKAGRDGQLDAQQAYLTDRVPDSLSHVMFFVSSADPCQLGANSAQSPVALLQQDSIADITTFMISVGQRSDGTAIPWL